VEDSAPRQAQRVLSPEINFIMTDILREVIREGTGKRARELKRDDLAGKTGTTNDYHDAWFSGFNGDIVTTVWVGFDQPTTLGRGEAGSRAALPVWIDYMQEALTTVPEKSLPVPENVEIRLINRETGQPTGADDPDVMEEYFIKGMEASSDTATDGQTSVTPVPEPIQENIREKLF
jgi:penicillin-binding protein 1A